MSFFVWPREAALLGCALQEYLGAWDYGEKPCFLEIITKRLRPFYPPAGRILSGMVKEDDLPKDIAWDAVPGFLRAGFAPSVPESWFVGAGQAQLRPDDAAECPPGEDAALCPLHDDAFLSVAIEAMARRRLAIRSTRTDPTARNLLDLIVELVAPHLARSPKDDAAFNLTREDAPWGLLQKRAFVHASSARTGVDDSKAIEAAISPLGSENAALFSAGRAVGGALAECDYSERQLFWLFQIGNAERFLDLGDDWRRGHLPDKLAQLQASPLLDPYGIAANLLRHLVENPGRAVLDPEKWPDDTDDDCCDGGDDWQDDVADEIRNLSSVRDAVWLAFGEILHGAQGAPDGGAGAPRLAASQMLRMVRLTEESTPDKIRGTLRQVQEMLERGDLTAIPESVIRELGPAIEGLARRVWRERFETYPPPTVTSVLHEGLQDSDERARRFASIAMSLYKTYRNPSQHDIDRFACGLNEAMMFFLGIRQLLDWSEAIARR